jgi:hypothetical protein
MTLPLNILAHMVGGCMVLGIVAWRPRCRPWLELSSLGLESVLSQRPCGRCACIPEPAPCEYDARFRGIGAVWPHRMFGAWLRVSEMPARAAAVWPLA